MRLLFRSLIIIAWVLFASQASALTLCSWNLMRLGHKNHKNYTQVARVIAHTGCDFLAVQEVMKLEGVKKVAGAVADATGMKWKYMVSHQIGRHSYTEAYAYFWNPAVVHYDGGAVVYLDPGDRFEREPFSAQFSTNKGFEWTAATVHILYGKRRSDRTPEIRELAGYWRWLSETFDDRPIILTGDFNLEPGDRAWAPLKALATPLLTTGASTLSSHNGRYAHLYDQIWVPRDSHQTGMSAYIVKYPPLLGLMHKQARKTVSDHAPVAVEIPDS